jgi:hypothetical protein
VGHHRCLWYIDRSDETMDAVAATFITSEQIIQVGCILANHGELESKYEVVMRIGRDPILYAPIAQ